MARAKHRWSLAMALSLALQAIATPSVHVDMKAAFLAGPYLLELLETAAGENSSAYFPLLDRVASGYFAEEKTDAALYNKFLDILQEDGHITTPESLSTFNLALSLRSAAPRIEAHYQYYSTGVEPTVSSSPECAAWVLFEGKQYCTPALDEVVKDGLFSSQIINLPFDRISGAGREAILYADPASPLFGTFHEPLAKAAKHGALRYRLRYRRSEELTAGKVPVSGYGVELTLKRTDYIVIDDRNDAEGTAQKPLASDVVLDVEEEVADLKPLSKSELASLGVKTASFILQSSDPLATLVKLTQDFPKFSNSIISHNTSENVLEDFRKNQALRIPPGVNFLWLNGFQLIERQIEPFALVEMLRRERQLIDNVKSHGLTGNQAVSLLGHEQVVNSKGGEDVARYDWTDRPENGNALVWFNDLEQDARYEDYPKELSAVLQRTYPGQLPAVAKNIFVLVAAVDFSDVSDLAFIAKLVNFVLRGIPVRFGFVPMTSTPNALAQAKVIYYLSTTYGTEAVLSYVQDISASDDKTASEKAFTAAINGREALPDFETKAFTEVIADGSHATQIKSSQTWVQRLKADSETGTMFINGVALPRDESWMQAMGMRMSDDLPVIQKGVYHGTITEEIWLPGVFLEKAAIRRNTYIIPNEEKDIRILDVNQIYNEHMTLLEKVPVLESFLESTKETWAVVTVLADISSEDGQKLVISALKFKESNPGIQLSLIHNPHDSTGGAAVNAALKAAETKLIEVEKLEELKSIIGASDSNLDSEEYDKALAGFLQSFNLAAGSQLVLLNGRLVGPLPSDALFDTDDFQQLLEFEQTSRILPVYAALDALEIGDKLSGPLAAAKLTSLTALSTLSDLPEGIFESAATIRSTPYEAWNSEHTTIEVGDKASANIHIIGLLDPVSEQGQRWAPILKVLSSLDGVYLKLFMNPKQKIDELPVKRFFRYVLEPKPSFDEAGRVQGLRAIFKGLPSEALLTTAMNVPPAWLVAPKASPQDLDNIKLSALKSDVHATYELNNILIEGHSREGQGQAPKGAQLVLGTEKDPLLTDTIIMANLGFFQFKANPGFYQIKLKEGRSSEIYEIESIGSQKSAATPSYDSTTLAIMDFQGTTLYPRLNRRPGMDKEDVLQEGDEAEGENILSKGIKFAGGLFGGGSKKSLSQTEHADINIFSVASGHLYERMLNIMMVSVMRHTKSTVKFWFIEQFLSPSFKEFIPHLAKEYGFKYEMISYKWPHWLRQQKEKQREIWGYKILFLDVLFPLSLDKVIFVDADQIVRTDMMDLVNLDLEGAPYGFTPMCDSRVEMEGFRFWKQGYWSNYLRGQPYHISALYVVDLRRFRELAAGDRLRQQYHALSADPNSLANLDQDLPNHMQFQIPIHSLPQEWLWCETWCSDESLKEARTIDLCNNPQTKEPKLDRARRQVPEWTIYDDEIAALDKRRKQEKAVSSSTSTSTETVSSTIEETISVTIRANDAKTEDGKAKEQANTKSRKFEEENVHTIDEL